MTTRFLMLVLLSLAMPSIANAGKPVNAVIKLAPDGSAAVNEAQAKNIFHQCSRPAPVPDGGINLPTSADISNLERLLPKYLAQLQKQGKPVPSSSTEFSRQYVAFKRGGRHFIYGSFYPMDKAHFAAHSNGNIVMVCDGGKSFWGIVYEPSTKKFSELEFNGAY